MSNNVEVIEEENLINFDDDYAWRSFTLYPETKRIQTHLSIKDDYYTRNETYEYKISLSPIEIQIRLIGRSDRGSSPKDLVKDGVVLEAEISKDRTYSEGTIGELKTEIEWHASDYGYETLFLILSKHPEIISKDEYRKFVRQTEQRIKLGLLKAEELLKNRNIPGLQILEGEYGKQVWYGDDKQPTEDKLKEAVEYVEKNVYMPLFNKESSEYSGISDWEFRSSNKILDYTEQVLNKKVDRSSGNQTSRDSIGQPSPVKRKVNIYSYLVYGLTILFIILKIIGSIQWNWFFVLSPFLLWEGLGFIFGFLRGLNK
jgi:hypothetical protein